MMNLKRSQNLDRKATAPFGAIAASNFWGLPAFAQANVNTPNSNGSQTKSQRSQMNAAECVPETNQADPRTAVPGESSLGGNQAEQQDARNVSPNQTPQSGAITSGDRPYNNRTTGSSNYPASQVDSSTTNTDLNNPNGTIQSGNVPYGDRNTGNQTYDQTIAVLNDS